MVVLVARALWLAPILLLAIALFLVRAGSGQKSTLESGEPAVARVLDVETRKRPDVTYGYADLRIPANGSDSVDVRLSLPISLSTALEGSSTVAVRLLSDGPNPVVIEDIGRAQWRMSFIHALMSGVGALFLAVGVFAWNRYLKRSGDPGASSDD